MGLNECSVWSFTVVTVNGKGSLAAEGYHRLIMGSSVVVFEGGKSKPKSSLDLHDFVSSILRASPSFRF